MNYNKSNIEAFILTYNRKEFLKESIKSLLNQTIGDIDITVMNNGSTDDTENTVKELQIEHPNLHYHKREENGTQLQNFLEAVSLAKKEFVILFHDDDILHPDYLNYAIRAINKYPNTAVVSSAYREYSNPTNENWAKASEGFYYCENKGDFADYLCYIQKFAYPLTIYRTSNLKSMLNNFPDIQKFGKVGDKPFVIMSMQDDDGAVIFKSRNLLRYRVHAGQDTKSSGPYYEELIEFNKFYKSFMQRNWYSNFLFNLVNYKQLKSGYVWGKDETLSLSEFIQKAIDEGAGCFYTKLCISKCGKLFIELAHILRKVFKTRYKRDFRL